MQRVEAQLIRVQSRNRNLSGTGLSVNQESGSLQSCTEYLDKIKFKYTELNCQTEEISRQETISVSTEEAVGMFKTAPTEDHLLCCTETIRKMFSGKPLPLTRSIF